ncbi:MAG: choice-of-anchor D domain-containing protein [Acidobacteriota bacterium]|nr:choice-of-anchor D domain-containing protein [Acidobacteriota bacterium]
MTNTRFRSRFSSGITLVLLSLLIPTAASAQRLFELSPSTDASQDARAIQTNVSLASQLATDSLVKMTLPSGKQVSGTVKERLVGADLKRDLGPRETARIPVAFDDGAGGLVYIVTNNTITGVILHDAKTREFFRATFDSNGRGVLRQVDANDYVCVDFPREPEGAAADSELARTMAALESTPDLTTLQNLESKPGASKTLYLDYWGGTISGTAWNDNYNSGNDINYTPYDTDGNVGSFSSTERHVMWLGWRETVEDYAAYDINVTTRTSVYAATPIANRSRIIATTTDYFYPGAGGVAYVGIFGNASDYYKTGWAWNSSVGSLGMTIAHEAGHQMGLGHDGTSALSYYGGHGVWGPIMGAPFWKPYVQWSQGEYPDANNSENDLATIGAVLGTDPDDAGDSVATATPLPFPVEDFEGHITPDGLFGDVDVYSFTLGSARTVHFELSPLLGDAGESRAANLAMNATLREGPTVISSMTSGDNAPLDPTTNTLVYDGILPAGTYSIEIQAVSPDSNWATGFGEYGNGGEYRITLLEVPNIEVPGPVDFGEVCVGSTKNEALDVCNTGSADLAVASIASSNAQFGVTPPLPSGYPLNVLPGACFPFQAFFGPTSSGPQAGQLAIASNDPDEPIVNVQVEGLGTLQDIQVAGSTSFGTVSAWSSGEQSVEVCNIGLCGLTVSSASLSCPDFTIVTNPLPAALGPGSCTSLTARFTPTVPGSPSCVLSVNSDDPDTPVVNRTLTARTSPAFSIHAGIANAKGALKNTNDDGMTINLDFVYDVNAHWAWDVRLGTSELAGKAANPDVDIWSLAGNARYTFNPLASWHVFINGGLGLYQFDPGDLEGGGNLGLGLQFPIDPRFSLEATYNYHDAFTASTDLKYDQIQLGLLVSF